MFRYKQMELGLFMYAIIALAITFMFYTGDHRVEIINNTSREDHAPVLLSSFWFREKKLRGIGHWLITLGIYTSVERHVQTIPGKIFLQEPIGREQKSDVVFFNILLNILCHRSY